MLAASLVMGRNSFKLQGTHFFADRSDGTIKQDQAQEKPHSLQNKAQNHLSVVDK